MSAPRHGFMDVSSQDARGCGRRLSRYPAPQQRGSPYRTRPSRCYPRAADHASEACARRSASKERRKQLASGSRTATTRPTRPRAKRFPSRIAERPCEAEPAKDIAQAQPARLLLLLLLLGGCTAAPRASGRCRLLRATALLLLRWAGSPRPLQLLDCAQSL
jgi:hypothetical protein